MVRLSPTPILLGLNLFSGKSWRVWGTNKDPVKVKITEKREKCNKKTVFMSEAPL